MTRSNMCKTLLAVAGLIGLFIIVQHVIDSPAPYPARIRSTASPKGSVEAKKARVEHFFRLMRDPATNRIPSNIRQRELAYARSLPTTADRLKSNNELQIAWEEAGPTDVGGRTRGVAVDVTNSDIILSGGVSGGVWKSLDNGATWYLTDAPVEGISVTSLAQDTRPGHTNVWYYATGEYYGSSSDMGGVAAVFGTGLYKSTDNGETWQQLASTASGSSIIWDNPFDFAVRVAVNPITGSVYAACNGYGIYSSHDEGASFQLEIGGEADLKWPDVAIGPDGTVVATLSHVV